MLRRNQERVEKGDAGDRRGCSEEQAGYYPVWQNRDGKGRRPGCGCLVHWICRKNTTEGSGESRGENVYFCVHLGKNDGREVSSALAKETAIRIVMDEYKEQ